MSLFGMVLLVRCPFLGCAYYSDEVSSFGNYCKSFKRGLKTLEPCVWVMPCWSTDIQQGLFEQPCIHKPVPSFSCISLIPRLRMNPIYTHGHQSHIHTGFSILGFTSVSCPGFTSVSCPNFTSVSCPGYTSVSCPGFTSVSYPGYTSVSCPGFTSVSCPGFTSVSCPGYTSVSCPGFTSVSCPGFKCMWLIL